MGLLKMWRRVFSKEVLEQKASKNKRRNVRRKNERNKKQAICAMGRRAHKVPQIRKLTNKIERYYKLFKILLRRAKPNDLSYAGHLNIEGQRHCVNMIQSRRERLMNITSYK